MARLSGLPVFLICFSLILEFIMFMASWHLQSEQATALKDSFTMVSEVASKLASDSVAELKTRLRVMEDTEVWVFGSLKGSHQEIQLLNEANQNLETEQLDLKKKLEYAKAENLKLKAALQMAKKAPLTGGTDQPSLLVAVITTPRTGVDYLTGSFQQIHNQFKLVNHSASVRSLVVNTRPGAHPDFEKLKEKFGGSSINSFLELESKQNLEEPTKRSDDLPLFGGNATAAQIRLNADLLVFLGAASAQCLDNGLGYVLLMEDDFEWCPGALLHVMNAIRLAEARPKAKGEELGWIAIRTSVGLNGIVLHCQDLSTLISVGELKWSTVPLDSLFGGIWVNAKDMLGREYLIYRHNLFSHIGEISAKGGNHTVNPNQGALYTETPRCFDPIRYIGLFPAEYFPDECMDHSFSPCGTTDL